MRQRGKDERTRPCCVGEGKGAQVCEGGPALGGEEWGEVSVSVQGIEDWMALLRECVRARERVLARGRIAKIVSLHDVTLPVPFSVRR